MYVCQIAVMEKLMSVMMIVLLTVSVSQSQAPPPRSNVGSCPPIVGSSLGSNTTRSAMGLVSASISQTPLVRILDYRIVCEAAGLRRGTISSFSAVVMFECQGTLCGTADAGGTFTRYLNLDCDQDNTFAMTNVQRGTEISAPMATNPLNISLNNRCGECTQLARNPNYCAACSASCNEGQRRCVGIGSNQCCNWYLNNMCVATCPSPLVGSATTFNCDCEMLQVPANGNIEYTDGRVIGSVATYSCDESIGYVPADTGRSPFTRTCQESGWSSLTLTTCILHRCDNTGIGNPVNGSVNISSSDFGSVATYKCDPGFILSGNQRRTCMLDGWDGIQPTCGTSGADQSMTTCRRNILIAVVVTFFLTIVALDSTAYI